MPPERYTDKKLEMLKLVRKRESHEMHNHCRFFSLTDKLNGQNDIARAFSTKCLCIITWLFYSLACEGFIFSGSKQSKDKDVKIVISFSFPTFLQDPK